MLFPCAIRSWCVRQSNLSVGSKRVGMQGTSWLYPGETLRCNAYPHCLGQDSVTTLTVCDITSRFSAFRVYPYNAECTQAVVLSRLRSLKRFTQDHGGDASGSCFCCASELHPLFWQLERVWEQLIVATRTADGTPESMHAQRGPDPFVAGVAAAQEHS